MIECLSANVTSLSEDCRSEILRIAEFQSDDYHLDRSLYLACKRDRQRLCSTVKSGNGRVYECLMKNKMNAEMSKKCRSQITRRQKLISEDYKVSVGIARGCSAEIRDNKCVLKNPHDEEHATFRLTKVLLCLEGAMHKDPTSIGAVCLNEMREHRRMLVEDFRISPEVVGACRKAIKQHCDGERGLAARTTLHCLLGAASRGELGNAACEAQLKTLLREVDVASDWRVDPLLQKTCQEVVEASECDPEEGNEAVLNCLLMLNAKRSRHMTRDCSNTLMEIQYFMARDFKLNPKLYRKCHKDAERLCMAEPDWQETAGNGKMIFQCLVRYLYVDEREDPDDEIEELSHDCAEQVEKTLERRASSVKLHPDIEESCRGFLIQYCSEQTGPGEELLCLQNRIRDLDEQCEKAVKAYTRIESHNVGLNAFVSTACRETIDQHCKAAEEKRGEGRVMRCLIDFKTRHANEIDHMTDKCVTAVEHWQILALGDWKLSRAFKKACTDDVKTHCEAPKTKADVLVCLTKILQTDMIDYKPVIRVYEA